MKTNPNPHPSNFTIEPKRSEIDYIVGFQPIPPMVSHGIERAVYTVGVGSPIILIKYVDINSTYDNTHT